MSKVNVLQVKDAEFKFKFSWWSSWVDVAVFDYGTTGYVLQMKVSRTNRKKFSTSAFNGSLGQANTSQAGDLTQMGAQLEKGNE